MTEGDSKRPQNELAPMSPGTAAAVFEILWSALADLLGAAATATLIRRSAKRAAVRAPLLRDLSVVRDGFEYHYTLPPSWKEVGAPDALRDLVDELRPILVELTGPVVLHRLQSIPELVRSGLLSPEAKP